ncbi:unnamed protein product [Brassicogethes aeneus]|uniref:Xyloside xylosyltransferase 1 n=1 Tax=Brassicogethes aeneus TaxID=1431903 RepID=A0A9P0B8M3_BRAAE|nr:unnamed protein product [Brassicogethes aeneus]
MSIRKFKLLNICIVIVVLCVFIYALFYTNVHSYINYTSEEVPSILKPFEEHNVWLIFTKVDRKSPLRTKFRKLIINMLNVSSVPLKFNIITDLSSKEIAEQEISDIILNTNKLLPYSIYDFDLCAIKIKNIVDVMTPHFSSRPGSYYSSALFYLSLGLHRIAPENQEKAIMLDCDLYFKDDVALLFKEFYHFKPTALFGLAPELTTVYLHILQSFRKSNKNSTFGNYYHENDISGNSVHPKGFQGYNSGVLLLNLKKIRNSKEYNEILSKQSVDGMAEKYKFRGHLGDQDFFTLMGYEHPDLIQTIHCGFNRQLCTFWRDHGYQKVFKDYARCNHSTVVLHGNCNTKIPTN